MRIVWRYEIPLDAVKENDGEFTIEMPLFAQVLHVDVQQRAPHMPSMWVLADDAEKRVVKRKFLLTGTGAQGSEPPAEHSAYIGTFQDMGFVWHIFEAAEPWPGEEDANALLRDVSIPLEV